MIPYIPQAVMGTVYSEIFLKNSTGNLPEPRDLLLCVLLKATMISSTVNGESSSLAVSEVINNFYVFI